jgi:hypothetical protein
VIVYTAVRIHVMFILNIPNLQRVKLDYFMFHFVLCYDKHNMNLAVLMAQWQNSVHVVVECPLTYSVQVIPNL